MQVREYVVQLENHLAEVHRQSQRLIERQSKLGSSMSEFGASMVALGKFESGSLARHSCSCQSGTFTMTHPTT